jgi:tetratricopeptide (TPR) repeat protein
MAHSVDPALRKAQNGNKNGEPEQIGQSKGSVGERFPAIKRIIRGLGLNGSPKTAPVLPAAELPQDQFNALVALFGQGKLVEVVQQASLMVAEFPNAFVLHNILGAANVGLRNLDGAIACFGRALELKPDYAEAHNSLGIALKDKGCVGEAIASFAKALEIKPGFAEAHNNLGAALKDLGRLDEAIVSYRKALEINPGFAQAHNNLGVALKGRGRMGEAVASIGRALEIKPDFAEAHTSLGIALKDMGRVDEAIASFRKALQIKGDHAGVYNNLGIALKDVGRVDEAIASFGKALQIAPSYAEAYNNLGTVLKELGRSEEAIASFGKALDIKPDFAEAHNNLGSALQDQHRLKDAIASFGKALEIKPDFAEAHNNLGIALKNQGRLDEAVESYGRALQIKPDFAAAYGNLCELYEKQNNLVELEKSLEKAALFCGENNADILFRRAQLTSHKKLDDEAVGYLSRVQVDRLHPSLKQGYFSLLGKTCDRLERFDEAFSAFGKQNALAQISGEAKKFNADGYLNSILERRKAWSARVKPAWLNSEIGGKRASPTFLIGFPRSGTTLLDSILRSHPRIEVVEEMPLVTAMSKAFGRSQTIQNLNTLSAAEVLGLRNAYFEELEPHLDRGHGGKLVVDKLPLNIVHVGIIHRVFPDAKFILVLRHPCDCVLSCFMQTFELNDAMANFLDLDQSARLYAAVMGLWTAYGRKLNLDVHTLKYEDLVQNLEGTCKPLIRFLGLKWDDGLFDYQKTALGRRSINTPSYSQVVQPLYKQAKGRWVNYRKPMQSVLPVLQPWIDTFGY